MAMPSEINGASTSPESNPAILSLRRSYNPMFALSNTIDGQKATTTTRTITNPTDTGSAPPVPRPLQAWIRDQTTLFTGIQDKIACLIQEWYKQCDNGMSNVDIINDAYGQIVSTGWNAVSPLLREVQKQKGHWFEALTWITGEDPIAPESKGSVRELRKAWIEWGKRNGYIG